VWHGGSPVDPEARSGSKPADVQRLSRQEKSMLKRNCFLGMGLAVCAAAGLIGSGCNVAGAGPATVGGGDGPGAEAPRSAGQVDPSMIRVVFVNETGAVVDTQFYVSANAGGDDADSLFVPANRVTDRIGVAGTGLLIPLVSDRLELVCATGMQLGVDGGRFLDRDTGEELGVGTRRVVEQGLVFDCGAEIVFTYKSVGEDFTVAVDHGGGGAE
jgi:hypothetical protein